MYKLAAFIDRHKYGILVTLGVHVALFFYFQVATYEEKIEFDRWEFDGRFIEKDDIEISPDQIETPEEQMLFEQQEVKNVVKNVEDKRELVENPENYTSTEIDPSQNAYDVEEAMKDDINSGKPEGPTPSNDIIDVSETETPKLNKEKKPSNNLQSSAKGVKAKTMVSFKLSDRNPLNNNDWYIRNPGYTCGNVDGVVVVEIKVGQDGKVSSAKYNSSRSKNANACMIEKAEEYALMSRFNYSENAPKNQSGYIQYTFIYQ